LSLKIKKPVVLTCYDLIHEKFLQHDKVMLMKKKETLNRATRILAISQSTKNDLMEFYGIPNEKIDVVHLANSLKRPDDAAQSLSEKNEINYFLYVGLRNEYKNFGLFVRAIAPLLASRPELHLYCAGGGKFATDELKLFHELGIGDKLSQHPGSDQSLAKLYAKAVAFFYPSLYEGFGIPLLEAMSCGCPVVASNRSSLPEIAQDAALYFDPTEKESILATAEKILNTHGLRAALIEKGYKQEKKFSWDKTTRESYEIYKKLL
jgi:glycosyltransferase involved in cell wall biosynthesis